MLLWILFAVLTAAVVIAVTRPLGRTASDSLDPASADLAVYRDQLAEIDADRDRGLVDAAEAEAARAEVARRLLQRAGKGGTGGVSQASDRLGKRLALGAGALIPLVSIGLYIAIGSPELPDQPHAMRVTQTAGKPGLAELVAQVEARLREKPDDGAGWDVIAPVYMIQKRYTESAAAYTRAIKLLGESPKRVGGLAEANVLANNGLVNEDARRAYERLLQLEPSRYEARFWLAMAKEQDGKRDEAIAGYRDMLATAPADASWREAVESRLKELGAEPPPAAPAPAAPPAAPKTSAAPSAPAQPSAPPGMGPPVDASAAADMSAAEREAMVGRMVSGLADRLKVNGRDLDGWQRLVRAYKVMGKDDAARTALADARRNFADDATALATLDGLARSLGLGS